MNKLRLRRPAVPLAACLAASGCGLLSDDVEPLRAQVRALEEREAEQNRRHETLEERISTLEAALVLSSRAPGQASHPQPRDPMDPDLKRRLDAVGVEVIEQLAASKEMQQTAKSLGELFNELIQDELRKE